jgi:plastocyanin
MVRAAATAALLAVVATACGGGDGDATVTIRDQAFQPDTITIAAGEQVTWEWDDGETEHAVVGFDFEEPPRADGTFTRSFDEVGSYDYA